MKGELLLEGRESVKYTPYRGSVSPDSLTVGENNKELSLFGKIMSEINSLGGRAAKKLRDASYQVNALPFQMAHNGGRRHRESAASRSYN